MADNSYTEVTEKLARWVLASGYLYANRTIRYYNVYMTLASINSKYFIKLFSRNS